MTRTVPAGLLARHLQQLSCCSQHGYGSGTLADRGGPTQETHRRGGPYLPYGPGEALYPGDPSLPQGPCPFLPSVTPSRPYEQVIWRWAALGGPDLKSPRSLCTFPAHPASQGQGLPSHHGVPGVGPYRTPSSVGCAKTPWPQGSRSHAQLPRPAPSERPVRGQGCKCSRPGRAEPGRRTSLHCRRHRR